VNKKYLLYNRIINTATKELNPENEKILREPL
jgi:hypothetical protein